MKKIIIPVVFALVGTCFTAYSFLDTFVIPKEYAGAYDASAGASNFSFSFANMSNSSVHSSIPSSSSFSISSSVSSQTSTSVPTSSITSSSSAVSSSSSQIDSSKYYEDLTPEQINALFTEQVVFEAKKHYSDPDIYIDITTDRYVDRNGKEYSTYYLADIRIKNVGLLKTALAHDKAGENITENTSDMCIRHRGIIAIDGDTYGAQKSGYVIRNGQKIRSSKNLSRRRPEDLAIYADGTFEIFNEKDCTLDEIAEKGAWQVFSFGPGLVKDGVRIIETNEEVGTAATQNRNQRCAIGMVAPLHYIFLVSDGRIKESPGLSLYQIGRIMEENHAYCAYNLDGGGSATMYFDDGTGNANGNGALVNYCTQQLVDDRVPLPEAPKIEERGVSDCVYIGKE